MRDENVRMAYCFKYYKLKLQNRVYDKMQMRMRDRILNLKTTILMN